MIIWEKSYVVYDEYDIANYLDKLTHIWSAKVVIDLYYYARVVTVLVRLRPNNMHDITYNLNVGSGEWREVTEDYIIRKVGEHKEQV